MSFSIPDICETGKVFLKTFFKRKKEPYPSILTLLPGQSPPRPQASGCLGDSWQGKQPSAKRAQTQAVEWRPCCTVAGAHQVPLASCVSLTNQEPTGAW